MQGKKCFTLDQLVKEVLQGTSQAFVLKKKKT